MEGVDVPELPSDVLRLIWTRACTPPPRADPGASRRAWGVCRLVCREWRDGVAEVWRPSYKTSRYVFLFETDADRRECVLTYCDVVLCLCSPTGWPLGRASKASVDRGFLDERRSVIYSDVCVCGESEIYDQFLRYMDVHAVRLATSWNEVVRAVRYEEARQDGRAVVAYSDMAYMVERATRWLTRPAVRCLQRCLDRFDDMSDTDTDGISESESA
jgi:hypothetical protein